MSKNAYRGVDNVARKVKACYIGVDDVARKVNKIYIGDADGKAAFCYKAPEPPPPPYIVFRSAEPFTITVTYTGAKLSYSTDGQEWNEWDISWNKELSGKTLYFRGKGNNGSQLQGSGGYSGEGFWVINGSNVSCSGNVEALVDYEKVEAGAVQAGTYEYRFQYMFRNCSALVSAPALPATELETGYYKGMFMGCTSLKKAPELPATSLSQYCYQNMFFNCTSLEEAPKLPATTTALYCYSYMFQACIALTKAPELPATTVNGGAYHGMFDGCTSLVEAPELPAENVYDYGYGQMFYGCKALKAIPKLPAKTLSSSSYFSMFNGCTGIKLSSTQDAEYTQEYRIPVSGTATGSSSTTFSYMFANTGGTFTEDPELGTTYYLHNSCSIV